MILSNISLLVLKMKNIIARCTLIKGLGLFYHLHNKNGKYIERSPQYF